MITIDDKGNKEIVDKEVPNEFGLKEFREHNINTIEPLVPSGSTYVKGATISCNYKVARSGNLIVVTISSIKGYEIDSVTVYVDDKDNPHYISDDDITMVEDLPSTMIMSFIMPEASVEINCGVKLPKR